MKAWQRQILLGALGGAVSAALTLWLRVYMPATDSFADLRDAPAILLAFFAGPCAALFAVAARRWVLLGERPSFALADRRLRKGRCLIITVSVSRIF